jgi:uncharacterized protein
VTKVTIEKRNHRGEFVLEYTGELVNQDAYSVCVQAVFERREANLGFVVFRQGDVFIEWFFADRWFNIFEVHDGDSETIKGWYCNITRPAVFETDRLWADDLELDIFVMPNGAIIMLDEDEFSQLELSTDERMATLRAIETLRAMVANRAVPFHRIA